jgi:hypothetical protein
MRVAARLQARGVLTTAQFEQAVAEHDKAAPGVRLFDMLVELGFASETEVTRARAENEGVPFIDLERFPPEPGALATVPEDLAHRHQALPMRKDGPNLFVAMADPRDIHAIDEIRVASRCTVRAMFAAPDQLREALARAYPGSATPSTPAAADLPTRDEQNETLALIVRELQALRAEVKQLRNEVARLHEQRATTSSGGPGARSSSRLLFPYARPDDTPRHIV